MRHDHPKRPMKPYPDAWEGIADFAYRSALMLTRPLNTVQSRLGPDADYVVGRDFEVDYRLECGEVRRLVVPHGLITDLTSVPWPLRVFIGRVGPWLEAAILHDYLYIAWQDVPGLGPRPRDRLFADRLMLSAMEAAAVPWLERHAIYWTVRLFGWPAYRRRNPQRYLDLDTADFPPAFQVPTS